MKGMRRCAGLIVLFVVCLTVRARAAESMPRLALNWNAILAAHPAWARAEAHMRAPSLDVLRSRAVPTESTPWIGAHLLLSLVARDWQGASRLAGSHLCVTDALRVSRSSRMLVSRIGLADGRLIPFVQVGLGQWRVDPDLLPIVRDTEMAGQLGGGFELTLAHDIGVALETDWTAFYRETHDPTQLPSPHAFSSFAVVRMEL